eukprot:GILK01007529.1.p1 GENE.GILK01007529.1~~GILK01007529.1.p1  ORF type:complete len:1345 (+),score=313.20 GILK01007529.1:153-4037(+)
MAADGRTKDKQFSELMNKLSTGLGDKEAQSLKGISAPGQPAGRGRGRKQQNNAIARVPASTGNPNQIPSAASTVVSTSQTGAKPTEAQYLQLHAQITAFKHLIRKLPVPEPVLTALRTHAQPHEVNDLLSRPEINGITTDSLVKFRVQDEEARKQIEGQEAMAMLELDPSFVAKQREAKVQKQLLARIAELQAQLETPLPEALRTKALMHLKMLQLREVQQRMRAAVLDEFLEDQDVGMEDTLIDRNAYKRARKLGSESKREAKLLEKLEKQMRMDQEQRKKVRQKEFITDLMNHCRDFKEFHRQKIQKVARTARSVRQHLEWLARKREQQRLKEEKERMMYLKNNNLDEYLKIVKTTKNHRLMELLTQTDAFLKDLGAKVRQEKMANDDESMDDADVVEEAGDELGMSTKRFYSLTHVISEEVTTQPEMLAGGTLKSYQMVGLQWMVSLYNNNLNGILADEMGLGKTIMTIALVSYIMEVKGGRGPFLIVVPLSTLSNWVLEFDRWAPKVQKVIFKGTPNVRKQLLQEVILPNNYNVLLTTYEFILKEKALAKVKWNYIIVDEGHRLKNSKSKFAQVLGQNFNSKHRLLLTGTPLQNNLSELWALLNFLLPKIFASVDEFDKWFNQPFSRLPGEKADLSEEEQLLVINRLHQVLRPFLLRRVKKEVESELPDKVENVLKCDLSAWQKHMYKQISEKGITSRDSSGKVSKKTLMNTMMQLRKICNHPYLFLEDDDFETTDEIIRSSGKFELLDRMLDKFINTRHRILIFSQMTHLMDVMERYFELKNYRYLRLDGSTKQEDRSDLLQKFNAPNSPFDIFLLSTRAGGLGLNLQTADTVIIFDSDWNPHMDAQAQDRAHRIGQKNEVRVYRIVTRTPIEEAILERAAFKLDIDEKIIQAGMFNTHATDFDRRNKLQELLKGEGEEDEDEQELLENEQLNEVLARSPEEFELFNTMDKERDEERQKVWNERRKKDKSLASKDAPRLMGEDEIPAWLIQAEVEEESGVRSYGRGARDRKRVVYNDGLSEKQWLRVIDEGGDIEEAIEKVRLKHRDGKKKKKTGRKSRIESDENSDDSEDDDDDEDAEESKRKVRRKRKTHSEDEEELPSRKRRKVVEDDGSDKDNKDGEEEEEWATSAPKGKRKSEPKPAQGGEKRKRGRPPKRKKVDTNEEEVMEDQSPKPVEADPAEPEAPQLEGPSTSPSSPSPAEAEAEDATPVDNKREDPVDNKQEDPVDNKQEESSEDKSPTPDAEAGDDMKSEEPSASTPPVSAEPVASDAQDDLKDEPTEAASDDMQTE